MAIDQMSTSRFDQIKIVISCDQVGVFDIEAQFAGFPAAKASVEYNDLLEAQFNGKIKLDIDIASVNVNLFLFLIHKKSVQARYIKTLLTVYCRFFA